jgi:hypothetical protein
MDHAPEIHCPECWVRWQVEKHHAQCSLKAYQCYNAQSYKYEFRTTREVMGDLWVINDNEKHDIADGY